MNEYERQLLGQPQGARLWNAVAVGENIVRVAGSSTVVLLPAIIPVKSGDLCIVLEQPSAGGLDRVIVGPISGGAVCMEADSYTPVLTSLDVGTTGAVNEANYVWIGGPNPGDTGQLAIRGRLVWGTAGTRTFPQSGSRMSLPDGFQIPGAPGTEGDPVGVITSRDVSASQAFTGILWRSSSTNVRPVLNRVLGSELTQNSPSAVTPLPWADGDILIWRVPAIEAVRV